MMPMARSRPTHYSYCSFLPCCGFLTALYGTSFVSRHGCTRTYVCPFHLLSLHLFRLIPLRPTPPFCCATFASTMPGTLPTMPRRLFWRYRYFARNIIILFEQKRLRWIAYWCIFIFVWYRIWVILRYQVSYFSRYFAMLTIIVRKSFDIY